MDPRRIKPGRGSASEFVQPLLDTLNTMRVQERLRPDQLTTRAEALLWERFGAEGGRAEAAFAHASLDIATEHTRYFDGIALLMPLQEGCAVACRSGSGRHRVAVEESASGLEAEIGDALRLLCAGTDQKLDVAVVTSLPPIVPSGPRAPALVALTRAVSALQARTTKEADDLAVLMDAKGPDRHVLAARLMAATPPPASGVILADTREGEFLPMDVPPMERPGLALLSPGELEGDIPARGANRKLLREIMTQLRSGGFKDLRSVREVEHRDLQRALAAVEKRHRPLLTFLITETARVQKMVIAIRRRDWQMFGALLLMSHAARVADLGLKDSGSDMIVKEIENMSLEGMYGGSRLSADSPTVLAAGQPFSVPPALERLRASFTERFDAPLTTLLL